MLIANIHQAKSDLTRLVAATLDGQSVLIAKNGVPVVKLVSVVSNKVDRVSGLFKGKIKMSGDFDEESEEINKMFNG